ncbi:MAG TPA: GNAT family N-acetyltransferase [Amycolatopsis sp.]|nr:GNAT family N-acetyltransferase [Amycolatopsis sp.]
MIALRTLSADDWAEWREMRLAALAEAPHAFGTRLADWQGAGDVEERWRARLADVDLNLLATYDWKPAGIVSGKLHEQGVVQVLSLYVAPFARGRGVGDELLRAVVRWAGERRVMLRVLEGNHPAENLYRRTGFTPAARYGSEREMVYRG